MKRRDFLKGAAIATVAIVTPVAARTRTYTFDELFNNTVLPNDRWHFLKDSPLRVGIIDELRKQGRLKKCEPRDSYYFTGTHPESSYGFQKSYCTKQACYSIPIKKEYSERELSAIAADVLEVLERYKYIVDEGKREGFAFFMKEPGRLHLNYTAVFNGR